MAEPLLDPGEQFRKAKRALLAISAASLLYSLASIGPDFEPQVLGHGVKIQSWIVSLGLLVYTVYLWIGFEHEQRRASAAHRELTYSVDFADRDPEQAINRLLAPVAEFATKVSNLSEELGQVERSYRQLTHDYRPDPLDVNSITFAKMKISHAMGEVVESFSASKEPGTTWMTTLERLRSELDEVPALVIEDVQKILRPGIEINAQRKIQADQTIDRLEELQQRMGDAAAILKIAHADISKLSKSLSARERYMFTFYDTWAPRTLAALAVIATGIDTLMSLLPAIGMLGQISILILGHIVSNCWKLF